MNSFRIIYKFCALLLASMSFTLQAQVVIPGGEEDPEKVNQQIEQISEQNDTELDYTELSENLKYFLDHPLNLNQADASDLKQLGLLNDMQIERLLTHIQKNGKLISLYELQSIDGFDQATISSILPYVNLSELSSFQQWSLRDIGKNSTNQLFIRYSRVLEEQAGYMEASDSLLEASPNSRYLGSADKIYTRYRFTYYNLLSFGITAEKDAGEEFFKGSQPNGFDFYSAHLFVRNIGPFRSVALGDYNLSFGQGLSVWSGLSFGKSAEAVGVKRSGRGISPCSSVDENNFLRGAAISVGLKKLTAYGFYSRKRIDGNLEGLDSLNNENTYITSIQESGLHNTVSTIADKDAIRQTFFGGRIEYRNNRINLGFTASHVIFSDSLKSGDQLYERFDFSGNALSNAGVDYSFIWRNFSFFGETAICSEGALATVNGVMLVPDRRLTISLLHRSLDKKYHSFYATAFSEGSTVSNEQGLYLGAEARFSAKWIFTAYADLFRFPWLKYRVDAPSQGSETLLQLNYKPSKKQLIYFRFRQENKEINYSAEPVNYLAPTLKRTWRVHASYPVSRTFTFKSRIEFLTYKEGSDKTREGFLIYHDIVWKNPESPLSLSFRYALFDTDTYDERLYAYENDVLYSYSIPAYYYKGSRFYLMARYTFNRNIDLWIRIARSHYTDRETVSSGLDEIEGSAKTDLRIQLRIRF